MNATRRQSQGSSRATVWTGAGIILSTGATFGASLYMVASANPAAYADIAILTVLVLIFGNLVRFGADRIVVTEVHAAERDGGSRAGRERGADIVSFAMLSGLMGGLLVCTPIVGIVLEHSLSAHLTSAETLAVGVWFASDVVRLVVGEAHRSLYRFRMAALASYGVRAPTFLVLLVAFRLVSGPLTRTDLVLASSASSVLVCVAALGFLSPEVHWWRAHPIRSGHRLWRGHLAMVTTTFAASLIGGADVWIVGTIGTSEETAAYALAVTLVGGLAVLAQAITGGIAPYLASALANEQYRQIQSTIIKYVRVAGLLAVVAFFGLVVVSGPLAVRLGGDSYDNITLFIVLLGAGQVVNSWAGIAGNVLIVARRYNIVMIVTVTVALTATALEAALGYGFDSVLLVCCVSAAGTALLPLTGCVALSRTLHMRTDVFGRC